MIVPSKFNGYTRDGIRRLYMGGGGGGPTQTTSTVQNTNIPEYAKPYVESMLGATQEQLFQGSRGPSTTNPTTGEVTQGDFNITGFKPYQAYGGTYDSQGKQTSYDPSKNIADFQQMQTDAQRGIQGLQMPGQYDTATNATQNAMNRAMAMQYNPAAINVQQAAGPSLQNYQMGPAREVSAQQVGTPMMGAAQTGYNPQLQNYQMGPSQQVSSQGIAAANIDAAQMGPAERVGAQSFTQPGSADQYMSPYMQNVVDIQKREATRQSGIQGTQQQAQATQAGAFGGSRDAIMRAERERNLGQQMGDIQTQGSQAAFQNAQQQFNTEQQARLAAQQSNQQAGLTTGMQNLNARQQTNVQNAANQMQAQGMNSQQAMQAALANQQAGLTTGSQNLAANLGVQQLGTQTGAQTALANLSNRQQQQTQNQAAQLQTRGMNSQQAMQAALANQQAGLTVGGQNLNASLGIQQLGAGQNMQAQLANQQALAQAQQLQANQQQFGANYGVQGIQAGMQGANQLAALGGQKLQTQQGIYGLQNQYGAQQQGLEQQKINQAVQDYSNTQQYPLMQLGTMSNMLRGLPMQASSAQQYQAAPNQLSQAIGTIGAGASMYNAMKAEGGVIKGYYGGGIMSYDVGGEVESDLESMSNDALAREAKESPSPTIRQKAQRILRERQMEQSAAPQGMAGGGIIAFQSGGTEAEKLAEARRQEALDADKTGDAVPLNMSSAPRPGLKEGLMSVGQGISKEIARPPLPSMRLDSDSAGLEAVPASAPAADADAAPRAAPPADAPRAAPAAPAGIKSAPGAAAVGEVGSTAPKVATGAQAAAEAAQTIADRPASAFLADVEAQKATLGPNVGQDEFRKQVMSERVNAADEAKRLKNMRLVEFFSTWGSTPGPTLVAGMEALKKSIPSFITDEKDQKKARQESDKLIYTLDEATRQEKLGNIKEATAQKEKAAERAMHLQQYLTTQQTSATSDASRERASKLTAELHLRGEELRANSARLDRKAARETADDNKRFNAYSVARDNEQRIINKITDQASGKGYLKDLDTIKTAKMTATDAQGNFDASKVPLSLRSGMEAAEERVVAQQKVWDGQKDMASKATELAYNRVRTLPENTPPDATKNRPLLSDPSLQK